MPSFVQFFIFFYFVQCFFRFLNAFLTVVKMFICLFQYLTYFHFIFLKIWTLEAFQISSVITNNDLACTYFWKMFVKYFKLFNLYIILSLYALALFYFSISYVKSIVYFSAHFGRCFCQSILFLVNSLYLCCTLLQILFGKSYSTSDSFIFVLNTIFW